MCLLSVLDTWKGNKVTQITNFREKWECISHVANEVQQDGREGFLGIRWSLWRNMSAFTEGNKSVTHCRSIQQIWMKKKNADNPSEKREVGFLKSVLAASCGSQHCLALPLGQAASWHRTWPWPGNGFLCSSASKGGSFASLWRHTWRMGFSNRFCLSKFVKKKKNLSRGQQIFFRFAMNSLFLWSYCSFVIWCLRYWDKYLQHKDLQGGFCVTENTEEGKYKVLYKNLHPYSADWIYKINFFFPAGFSPCLPLWCQPFFNFNVILVPFDKGSISNSSSPYVDPSLQWKGRMCETLDYYDLVMEWNRSFGCSWESARF